MSEYIKYTFYDDYNNLIAIVREDTPKEVMDELVLEYSEVRYVE